MIKDADMPPDKPTTAPTHLNRRFLWLVVVHIVVGWMGALSHIPLARTLRYGQGHLSASCSVRPVCWESGAVSERVPGGRELIGVVIGISYLVPVLGIGIHEVNSETFIVVVVATSFVANTIADRPVFPRCHSPGLFICCISWSHSVLYPSLDDFDFRGRLPDFHRETGAAPSLSMIRSSICF